MTALTDTLRRVAHPRDRGLVGLADGRLRLYVWQVPVRVTHWVTAGAIVVLSVTGGYIADPFLIPPGGSVMGNVRLIHMIAAFTLIVSGMVRTAWLLLGNRFARWSAFFPTSWNQATEMLRQAAFYAFLTRHHPKVLGHNQLAASAYVVLWALLLLETITGFALDGLLGAEPGATAFWWVRELLGPQNIRLIHHFSMWAIIAIALFHIYSCVLIDHIERNGLVSSIFSGYKYVSREEIVEARDGGPELLGDEAVEAAAVAVEPASVAVMPAAVAVEPVAVSEASAQAGSPTAAEIVAPEPGPAVGGDGAPT